MEGGEAVQSQQPGSTSSPSFSSDDDHQKTKQRRSRTNFTTDQLSQLKHHLTTDQLSELE